MKVYVDAKTIEKLKNPDCLSVDGLIFRKGGMVNGIEAIPCEVLENAHISGMDINQIKEKKALIEGQIRNLILEFSEQTGLVVEGIGHEMIDISSYGSPKRMQCTDVTLDVRLG